jgi:hypothetical protein
MIEMLRIFIKVHSLLGQALEMVYMLNFWSRYRIIWWICAIVRDGEEI